MAGVAPGNSLAEQCAHIAEAGCKGVETIVFPHDDLGQWQRGVRQAAGDAGLEVAAVILGGLALYMPGQEGWLTEAIAAVGEVGAGALMTPEFRAQEPLPMLPPYPMPSAEEQAQVWRAMEVVDGAARRSGVPIFLESLTQFEGRFWREVATVQAVCEALANPLIGIALDFHNMNITEANPIATIVRAGRWVRHVHLADSNRRLPGQGHIDFRAGVATLDAIGYDGWYSFECAVMGEFVPALRQAQARLATA
jgi:sugar phosphate isomerase/epimerase